MYCLDVLTGALLVYMLLKGWFWEGIFLGYWLHSISMVITG